METTKAGSPSADSCSPTVAVELSPEELAFLAQVLASVRPQGDTWQVLAALRLAGGIAKKLEEALGHVWPSDEGAKAKAGAVAP
jgi:hypothetical protein